MTSKEKDAEIERLRRENADLRKMLADLIARPVTVAPFPIVAPQPWTVPYVPPIVPYDPFNPTYNPPWWPLGGTWCGTTTSDHITVDGAVVAMVVNADSTH